MENLKVTMFVCGNRGIHQKAQKVLYAISRQNFNNMLQIEIVDVLKEPWKAEEHKVVATPTVVVNTPGNRKMVIGDLSDPTMLLDLLET